MKYKGIIITVMSGSCAACVNGNGQNETLEQAYARTFGVSEPVKAEEGSPNILLITSDQHHWMYMGYNNPGISTPNLDRLAAMGTIFDRAYTVNPVSTPTRASMITGMYPSQHGAYALGTKLDERVPVVGDIMQEAGYSTALIGKAHFQPLQGTAEFPSAEAYPMLQDLDFWRQFHGPFYGFGHIELARNHGDEAHVGQHYAIWMADNGAGNWKEWFQKPTGTSDEQTGAWNIPERHHLNEWITERTNAMLDTYKDSGKPFFLWASFFDPHPPYLVPEPWASMYDPEDMKIPETFYDDLKAMPAHYRVTKEPKADRSRWIDETEPFAVHGLNNQNRNIQRMKTRMALYYGMISYLDYSIGRILDKLEANGMLDHTLIIFTTDHGNLIGNHSLMAKGICDYEDAVKIPFCAAYKGHIPGNRRTDAMLSIVDLAPTMLSYLGIEKPYYMSGISQKDVWNGQTDKVRDHVIVENRFQPTKFYVKTYINERYKIAYDMNSDEGELFDLQNDPLEMHNLWNLPEYSVLKSKLLLEALQAEMKAEPGMPRIAGA
ncbi:MAG: sulfatase [Candidatus Cryptobacteroides sp.]